MRLVINTGSSSKKYALFDGNACVYTVRFEMNGDTYEMRVRTNDGEAPLRVSKDVYEGALKRFMTLAREDAILKDLRDITHVAVRIVAPGTYFQEHRIITDSYLDTLKNAEPYVPLHITPALLEIQNAKKLLSDAVVVGVSDSAFHKTQQKSAREYALFKSDTEAYDIRRFGYHGLSVSSVVRTISHDDGSTPPRMVVCHIGGGASVTALRGGESVATSMGFSPVSGLMMSTRIGDIDPGALLYLKEQKNLSGDALRSYLNTQAGLFGVTGGVSDMRTILQRYKADDALYQTALDMFIFHLRFYIGGYVAILGGIDALVLTGTVSERNAYARLLFYSDLTHLGIRFSSERNNALADRENGDIHVPKSDTAIHVIHTNEMDEMNRALDAVRT